MVERYLFEVIDAYETSSISKIPPPFNSPDHRAEEPSYRYALFRRYARRREGISIDVFLLAYADWSKQFNDFLSLALCLQFIMINDELNELTNFL